MIGAGRLQFYAAPDPLCRMTDVFILTGESVDALHEFSGFTSVRYRNPRTGVEVAGWVVSRRLEPNGQALSRRP